MRILSHYALSLAVVLMSSASSFAQFTTVGNAVSLGNNCYRLTQAVNSQNGSAWNQNTLDLSNDFDLYFDVNLGSNNGGADGIVFVLNNTQTASGTGGGGIGYLGINSSLGIEIDTWHNGNYNDITADHVAIISNGVTDHAAATNLAGPVQANSTSIDIEDGNDHVFRVQWDASANNLKVYFDCVLRLNYTGNIVNSIFGGNSTVYWGFTGSTGGASNVQKFCLRSTSTTATYNQELCLGDSIQLTPTAVNAQATYSWSPNSNISSTSAAQPLVYPASDFTYIVTINHPCSVLVDTFNIDVVTQYDAGFSYPSDTLCVNSSPSSPIINTPLGSFTGIGLIDSTNGTFDPAQAGVGAFNIVYSITGNCAASDTVTLNILPPADPSITPIDPLCLGDSDTLQAATAGGTWSGLGVTSNGFFNTSQLGYGSYPIIYTLSDPCLIRDTVSIEVVSPFNPQATSSFTLCSNDTVQLSGNPNIQFGNSPTYIEYWTGPGIFDTATGSFSGAITGPGGPMTVYYHVTTPQGTCGGVDSALVTVYNFASSDFTHDPMCDDITSNKRLFKDFPLGYWEVVPDGGANMFNPDGFIPADVGPGTWTLTYVVPDSVTANGCGSETTHNFTIYASPEAPGLIEDEFCYDSLIVLEADTSYDSLYWYSDQNGNNEINLGDIYAMLADSSTNQVTYYLRSVNGICSSPIEPRTVTIHDIPTADYNYDSIPLTVPVVIDLENLSIADEPASYLWIFADSTFTTEENPSITVDNLDINPYWVFLSVTSAKGCTDTIAYYYNLELSEVLVNIPNVFTPNNDGCNDFFGEYDATDCSEPGSIRFIQNYQNYTCIIYDRWGAKMYEFGPGGFWDGNNASDGVYYYVIQGTSTIGEAFEYSGSIQLMR